VLNRCSQTVQDSDIVTIDNKIIGSRMYRFNSVITNDSEWPCLQYSNVDKKSIAPADIRDSSRSRWFTRLISCMLSPIHTADAYATPTRLNSTVESRRRRRCVLGINLYSVYGRTIIIQLTVYFWPQLMVWHEYTIRLLVWHHSVKPLVSVGRYYNSRISTGPYIALTGKLIICVLPSIRYYPHYYAVLPKKPH